MKSRCSMWVLACWLLCAVSLFAANGPVADNSVDLSRAGGSASAPNGEVLLAADQSVLLPDAPNAALGQIIPKLGNPLALGGKSQNPAPPIREGYDRKVIDKKFLVVNGLMFASTVTAVETMTRCQESGGCSITPASLITRSKLYPIGLGSDGAITLLGYYLKAHHHRWWYVPAVAMIAGATVYSVQAASYLK